VRDTLVKLIDYVAGASSRIRTCDLWMHSARNSIFGHWYQLLL